eukprot:TRINITY_DN4275_c0_g1_i1.p1 TRINITY_DN4275_c0_g1~~TRINITY_DN4275_c0_g1_i1.p1  ORF type:complete len:989 (+),score=330.71 TRINITY_DN4275_c0_g1_i1:378-2969(+)
MDKAFNGQYRIVDCDVCASMIIDDDFSAHWANNKPPPTDKILQKITSPHISPLTTGFAEHEVIETDTVTKGEDEAGNKMINQYTCISDLGQGAYGKVKLVVHTPTGNYYAIKIIASKLRTSDVQNIEEIAIMKRCYHTNICTLHEVIYDTEGGKMYLILDYFEKGAVYDMSSGKPLPLEKVKKYLIGISQGLDYLHSHKIVHRDIKPDNILVGGDDEVRLTDFGISHSIHQDDEVADTRGTPAFLPPEVIRNEKIPGTMTDIWALGITMYILTCGQLPFTGTSYKDLSNSIITQLPDWEPITSVCPLLSSLLQGILNKNMKERIGYKNGIRDVLQHPFLANDPKAAIRKHSEINLTQEEKEKAILSGRNIRLNLGNTVGVMVKVRGAVEGFKGLSAMHKPVKSHGMGQGLIVVSDHSVKKPPLPPISTPPPAADDTSSESSSESSESGSVSQASGATLNVQKSETNSLAPQSTSQGKVSFRGAPSFRLQNSSAMLTPKRSFRTEEEAVMEETNDGDLIEILKSTRESNQVELTLNCVKFATLPLELLQCTKLKYFTSHLNGLRSLPVHIDKLVNLVTLSIAQNELKELPASLANLRNLTKLDCNHNKLVALPDSFGKMRQLKSIILDYNDLAEVPRCLCAITGLEKCFMANNERIGQIPKEAAAWAECSVAVTNTPQLTASWALDRQKFPNITMLWNKLYPDQVTETIFLGSLRTAQSELVLNTLNITKIVTAGKGLMVLNPLPSTVQQIILNVDDNPDQKLAPFFDDISAYLEEARVANEKVLVHCFAGLSRSVAVVCAYLIKTKAMPFKEAITLIKQARPSANPNDGFRRQLIEYEYDLYGTRLPADDIENHSNGPTVEDI